MGQVDGQRFPWGLSAPFCRACWVAHHSSTCFPCVSLGKGCCPLVFALFLEVMPLETPLNFTGCQRALRKDASVQPIIFIEE